MKYAKRFLVLVLMAVLCVTPLLSMPVAAADGDMRYGRSKLNADLQVIYDGLVAGCASAKAEIKIDISGRNIDLDNDLNLAYMMFYRDYPEYFWVTSGYKASYTKSSLTMKPQYNIPGGTWPPQRPSTMQSLRSLSPVSPARITRKPSFCTTG